MKFESLILEDRLPPSLETIRIGNMREYYSTEKRARNRPDLKRMGQLIRSGYSGVARNIIENWIVNNPPDIAILELLVSTNDESISPIRYMQWCRILLDLDSENEIALGGLVYHGERYNTNSTFGDEVEKLDSLYPDNTFGRMSRLQRHVSKGEYLDALNECNALIQCDSKNKFALRHRPIILSKIGDFKSAAEYWDIWLISGHASLDDKMASGKAHYNCKQYDQCISIMSEILDSYSDREMVLDLLVRSNYSLKNWTKCNFWCKELLSLNSQSFEGQKYMRLTKARMGFRIGIAMGDEDTETAKSNPNPEIDLWFDYF